MMRNLKLKSGQVILRIIQQSQSSHYKARIICTSLNQIHAIWQAIEKHFLGNWSKQKQARKHNLYVTNEHLTPAFRYRR